MDFLLYEVIKSAATLVPLHAAVIIGLPGY